MTKGEFGKMLSTIQAAYPRYQFLSDEESQNLWYDMFKDCKTEYINIAVRQYIMNSPYLPSISDIATLYKGVKETKMRERLRLRDYFHASKSVYPLSLTDSNDIYVFFDLLGAGCFDDQLERAQRIESAVRKYVPYAEQNLTDGEWLSFAECMKRGLME